MTSLIEKTLHTIESQNIRPHSRWRVRAQNIGYWFGTLFMLVLSSAVTALAVHAVFEIDWQAFLKADFSWLEILFSGVPFFMIILFVFFLVLSIVLLHHTRRGYRYPSSVLFSSFFFGVLVIGYGIEMTPFDEPLEKFMLGVIPRTEKYGAVLLPTTEQQWTQPEKGLLGGEVLEAEDETLELRDSNERDWSVEYSHAAVGKDVDLKPSEKIKVIGEKKDAKTFHATEIQVWSEKKKKSEPTKSESSVGQPRSEEKEEQEKTESVSREHEEGEDEEREQEQEQEHEEEEN